MDGSNRWGLEGYDSSTYGDAFADVYDDWYGDLGDEDFVAAVVASLPASPARVLDLGTGTGRIVRAVADARRGSDHFVGVDSSERMIELARDRTGRAGVEFVLGDFSRDLPPGPFEAIVAGYNTLFNLPDDTALASCLALVGERLAGDGRFLADCISPPLDDGGDHVGVRSMGAAEMVLSVSRHDPAERRITGQFVHLVDGATVRLRPWAVRYVAPDRMDQMAAEAGLVLVSRTGDGPGGEYTPRSPRHISTYRRR